MTASLTKVRIPFEKESTVSRCYQNSESWVTKQNLKKMRFTDANKKIWLPALATQSKAPTICLPIKIFSPWKLSFARWHNNAGKCFCNHIPIQGEGLTCIQWALCLWRGVLGCEETEIPFRDTTNRSYRRKMRPSKYKKDLRESWELSSH